MYSYTEENYLKAIYKLQQIKEEGIGTNEISELMQTRAASVTDMLKKLSDKDLIVYQCYKGVRLSRKGEHAAVMVVRKHRLWELFLVSKLDFKWDEVHDIAEQLEHIQSEDLIDKLDHFLGYPSVDPHGDPIPNRKGIFKKQEMRLVFDLKIREQGKLSGVKEHSPSFLQYLEKVGLQLGSNIKVEDKNDFDQSVWISINGAEPVTISKEIAQNLFIIDLGKKKK